MTCCEPGEKPVGFYEMIARQLAQWESKTPLPRRAEIEVTTDGEISDSDLLFFKIKHPGGSPSVRPEQTCSRTSPQQTLIIDFTGDSEDETKQSEFNEVDCREVLSYKLAYGQTIAFSIELTHKDVIALATSNWISDNVVGGALRLIARDVPKDWLAILDSNMIGGLKIGDSRPFEKFFDAVTPTWIMIPSFTASHWSLLVVLIEQVNDCYKIYMHCMDSLRTEPSSFAINVSARLEAAGFQVSMIMAKVPKQTNSDDCGLYAISFGKAVIDRIAVAADTNFEELGKPISSAADNSSTRATRSGKKKAKLWARLEEAFKRQVTLDKFAVLTREEVRNEFALAAMLPLFSTVYWCEYSEKRRGVWLCQRRPIQAPYNDSDIKRLAKKADESDSILIQWIGHPVTTYSCTNADLLFPLSRFKTSAEVHAMYPKMTKTLLSRLDKLLRAL